MAGIADNFRSLPVEFQEIIALAQKTFNIEVTPLQELKGGRTGAYLYLVSVTLIETGKVKHLILKLDHKSKKSKTDELERHSTAIKHAPPEFTKNHIADLVFDRIELEEAVAIFYSIAGQSLHNYQSLASYQQQNKLEKIFETTSKLLLESWNKNSKFEKAVHPQKVVANWLGYRINAGGNIERFMRDSCNIPNSTPGLMIQGQVFPNPLVYSQRAELWGKARPIDIITGFQHGDLNIGNILTTFDENGIELTGFYLIDFALFKTGMPLFYDLRYLEVSYLIRELSRLPLTKWTDMVIQFAEKDIIDPNKVPIELAGACSVIVAGRKTFSKWVNDNYPSLSDDLWGQYWLAAVAAGLNYCNKSTIQDKERLAGLIFASIYLKRYHSMFGVSLPVEVKYLNVISQSTEMAAAGNEIFYNKPNTNLPAETTPFIGRKKEIKKTTELLQREEIRLVTLTGPGGTGKTRLAIQASRELIDSFPDSIYFVDLAPLREPEAVLASIADITGLKETSSRPLIDELKIKLQSKKLLLLLDNFEQVTAAVPLIGELLLGCPKMKLLVTSREALHLRGEQIFPVPPLGLPQTDFKNQSVEQFTQFETVQLFIDRALAVKPDFEVTSDNMSAIAEICIRLDGLPLAIELAAARISLFSPKALLERVAVRLKLLRGGAKDLPERQQTLRNTISWSYELLNKNEQQLFTLLSVFSRFTFESVENVAGSIKLSEEMEFDILEGLTSLIDKSLIRREDRNSGEVQLIMLETIREYAEERLNENSEFAASARLAHAEYFADFAKGLWNNLTGLERESALETVEYSLENMRTAWRYWVKGKNLEQLYKLTNSLWLIYDARGWYYSSIGLTTDLLNVLSLTPTTPERAKQEIMLHTSLARVLMAIKGCTREVEEAYTNALELCKKYGEVPQLFPVLRALAGFYAYIGNFEKCMSFGEQILELAIKIKDINMEVEGQLVYGYSLAFIGRIKEGLEIMGNGIANYNPKLHAAQGFRFGNNPGVTSHTTSALCYWMTGFPDRSVKLADEAIKLADKLNHPFSEAYALFHTGLLHLWRKENEIARDRAIAVFEISDKHEFQIWKAVAKCLYGSAIAEMGQADKGIIEINNGIDMYSDLKTPPIFWPILLLLQAGTYVQAGKPGEGLEFVEEALNIMETGSGNPFLPEIYRLKGEVLLIVSKENLQKSESLFNKALELAQKQETKMFELRAAMSLNRLWQQNGETGKGVIILKEAYNKFTEGFTTFDLIEAKKLLEANA